MNTNKARVSCLILANHSHLQPPTPIHVDNTTVVRVVNNMITRQHSSPIEMLYFWLLDQALQHYFTFDYHSRAALMADYPTMAHTRLVHTHVNHITYTWTTLLQSQYTQLHLAHSEGVLG